MSLVDYFPKENTESIEEKVTAKNGAVITRKYKRGIMLGKGGFAKCYVVQNLDTGKTYAAKVIEHSSLRKPRAKEKLLMEISIHKGLKHPYIVQFKHQFEDAKAVYIIMELCPNQTLMEMLKREKHFSETKTRKYMTQLISALKYLHCNQIIHRDLKLGNLFLDKNWDLKLGDFGLAAKLSYPSERKRTICGTPNYIAPEVLSSSNGHSYEADVWSLGVILYTMLVGHPPFETKDIKTTYRRIRANVYTFPDSIPISEKSKTLVRLILHTVPEARPHLDDILESPFFAVSEEYEKEKTCLNNPIYSTTPHISLPINGNEISPALSSGTMNLKKVTGHIDPIAPPSIPPPPSTVTATTTTTTTSSSTAVKTSNINNPISSSTVPILPNPSNGVGNGILEVMDIKIEERVSPQMCENNNILLKSEKLQTISSSSAANTASTGITPAPGAKRDTLEAMHNLLDQSLATGIVAHDLTVDDYIPSRVWVTHYVDYSNKYGLGYLMCDGSIGMYFNDGTKIILESNGEWFEYIERVHTSHYPKLPPVTIREQISKYPEQLRKKVTLLNHFKGYLLEQRQQHGRNCVEEDAAWNEGSPNENMIYVKKWIKTRHAVLFRLSNRSVQISFFDKTELVLSNEARVVSYMDKNGSRTTGLLSEMMQGDKPNIAKRLKYARDVLHQLIKGAH